MLVPLSLPSEAQVDAGEDQRQLGRSHFDRYGIASNNRKLERAGFESLVPDRKAVTIPVENLKAIAAAIDEQEQVTGRRILGKGGSHQAGQRVEAFTEVGGWSVEKYTNCGREADHLEPPMLVLAPAMARMS
jgi:hypothetical protein